MSSDIQDCLKKYKPDMIWVEWNGMMPFSQLYSLFLTDSLKNLCKIEKVVHIADAETIGQLLGKTGAALPEQISNCDIAVLRNAYAPKTFHRIRHLLKGLNPDIYICKANAKNELYQELFQKRVHPLSMFFQSAAALFLLGTTLKLLIDILDINENLLINLFIGVILQAIPFLLIGILISSFIQVFIPTSVIERSFPKSIGLGMAAAVLFGFCLPVCDCTSIPILKGLVKKGIPLPAAVTFMTAAPVINPVVMLSTYYAFGGSLTYMLMRVCFGIVASVLIGLAFYFFPLKQPALPEITYDKTMCGCGFSELSDPATSLWGKIHVFFRHSQSEFYYIGKYLIMGALISSIFQALGTGLLSVPQKNGGLALSIIIMMAMAFVLSLCSSSDAVIAQSFTGLFPAGAIMGFLLFGPMIDIKNVMMLSSGFSKRFVIKLSLTAFIVCFLSVFLFFNFGGTL
ncbi:MAG: permease [Lacrimispora sp.]